MIADNALLQTTVGLNIDIEPIPISELTQYKTSFPNFLLEVFHNRVVQLWQEFLTSIFCRYVDLHFECIRPFSELQTRQVRLDFCSKAGIDEQIKGGLIRDYEFANYAERQKLIDQVRNPNRMEQAHLLNVHKNVQIRNALQHKGGVVDEFFLRSLGWQQIEILDEEGQPKVLRKGDRVSLSIPEFDSFRRSILMVAQTWRS